MRQAMLFAYKHMEIKRSQTKARF